MNLATGRTTVNFCSFVISNADVEIFYIAVIQQGVQRLPLMAKIFAPLTLMEMLISGEE